MNVRKWIFTGTFLLNGLFLPYFAQAAEVEKPIQEASSGQISAESARILEFKGDVRVWTDEAKAWKKASVGQVLIDGGNKIATGKNSEAIIAFDAEGKDVMRIEANSEMVLRSIKPKESMLAIGSVLVRLDRVKSGSRFKVITQGAGGRAYDVARRGNLMVVTGREGTVRVFGVSEENRGGDFYSRSWWGDQKVFR